jgi:acetyl-CoA C-acetyltransferase
VEPDDVEEVILGQAIQAGAGPNTARQASLRAGIPVGTPAYTVNMVCASGMKAMALAAAAIQAGEREIVVAGGTESMSQAPYLLPKGREGYRLGDGAVLDAILCDALTDPSLSCHMALTVEGLVKEYAISREAQDRFAAASQARAKAAAARGAFAKEIVEVAIPQRRGAAKVVATDEHPRPETTEESLARLAPVFAKDGTITAGNASGINDGAAAVVLMSDREADRRGLRSMARVAAWASAGVEPGRMGIGPVPASRRALERAGLS